MISLMVMASEISCYITRLYPTSEKVPRSLVVKALDCGPEIPSSSLSGGLNLCCDTYCRNT